jgi:hypothetical protein
MRIFSKYHDYYDGVLAYGSDPNCVYVRNEEEFRVDYPQNPHNPDEYKNIVENKHIAERLNLFPILQDYRISNYNYLQSGDSFLVLFCGKLYPCMTFHLPIKNVKGYSYTEKFKRYCYTLDEVIKIRDTYSHEKIKYYNPLSNQNLEAIYNVPKEVGMDIHYKTGIPSFLIKADMVVYNPILKPLRFASVMDPYTAFQELSMFISGILGGTSPPTIEVSNDIRIQKHGFDLKTSFRKPKE